MKKLLLSFCLLLTALSSWAHDFAVGGIYYKITSSTELTVAVTYRGDNYDSYSNEYKGNIAIPESVTYNTKTYSVTSIGNSTFRDCSGLTSVSIPESVTTIGGYAFLDCSGLTSAIIPNSVTTIGGGAFEDCSGLTSVTIGNSVTSIDGYTFKDCTGLTSVTIPSGVTSIGAQAFDGCTGLTSVSIPESVTSIEEGAFYKCSSLTSVTIPNSVTTIDNYTFEGCSKLTSVIIPNSVTSIGYSAFSGCSGLISVTIPNSVTSIGSSAFYNCYFLSGSFINNSALSDKKNWGATICDVETNDGLLIKDNIVVRCRPWATSITIPESVTSIGDGAFSNCTGLTSVSIKSNAITSESYSTSSTLAKIFGSQVKKYEFGEGVKSIGANACYNCMNIESVSISSTVTEIGKDAFKGCTKLERVDYASLKSLCGIKFGNNYSNPISLTHQFYIEEKEVTDAVIPNGVTSIGNYAFSGCSGLTSVTIGNSVTSIGNYAFYGCRDLTSVTIPNSVTSIGSSAFYNCYFLSSSFINNSELSDEKNWGATICDVETSDGLLIKDNTVVKCRSWVTSVAIPNSVTSIGNSAFENRTGLTSIIIPNSVTSIGQGAFRRCSGLTSINIPESITFIGGYAFSGCTGLTSVTIPNSVNNIGNAIFQGCGGLTSIVVDSKNIKYDSRNGCNAIIETETNSLIAGCNKTVIPESVTSIDIAAFENYSGLVSITIPNSVTSIGGWTFNGCSSLTDVYCFAENVPETGNYVFNRVPLADATLHVPENSIEAYKATAPWSNFGNIVALTDETPTGIESIRNAQMHNEGIHDLSGRKLSRMQKGINVIRMKDGSVKRMLVK